MGIKVEATAQGYYGRLIEAGEQFEIGSEDDLGVWMKKVTAKSSRTARAEETDTTEPA